VKDGTTYPRNTALAVLLLGQPGAGKSNTCFEFPDPYVIDADQNLRNAIERHPGKKFYYDCPEHETDDKGQITKVYEAHEHWPRMEKLIKENAPKPEVKGVVIDGLGRVSDYLKAYLVHVGSQAEKPLLVGGTKVMTQSLWSPFADLMKKLVFLCRSFNKPFIMTAHLKVDENELSSVKEQRVNLQGQLASDFAKLYTDAWLADAVPSSDAKYKAANGVRYFIRTAPTHRILLKQSCSLPAEFETSDECFKKLIASLTA
jgi:hypothetical protein